MIYMTEQKYISKLNRIKDRNLSRERKRKLWEERTKYYPKFVLPSTTKIVLFVAALLCVEILFFCQYMILKTNDTNALYAMVGTIVALATIVLGYFMKSTKENTSGGITFETAMLNQNNTLLNQINTQIIDSNIPNEAVG